MLFLSWEHPWLDGAMENLAGSSLGQAAVGTISLRGVPAGSRLYECLFATALNAPTRLQLRRYLPLTPQRIIVDGNGRDLTPLLPEDRLSGLVEKVPRAAAAKVVRRLQGEIEERLRGAEAIAAARFETALEEARQRLEDAMGGEVERLRALQALNGSVRDAEIDALQQQLADASAALATATLTLQGLRLVVTR